MSDNTKLIEEAEAEVYAAKAYPALHPTAPLFVRLTQALRESEEREARLVGVLETIASLPRDYTAPEVFDRAARNITSAALAAAKTVRMP